MYRISSTLTLGLLLALTGCGDDSSPPTGSGGSSSDGADSGTTMGTPTPATTAVDSSTTDPGTTTDDPGTTTDDPGTTTDDPGSTTDDPGTTTGEGMVCDPDAMDDDCAMCVKESCCMQLEACAADVDCTCFQDCAALMPGIAGATQCGMDCGVDPFGMGPTGSLVTCTIGSCAAQCT